MRRASRNTCVLAVKAERSPFPDWVLVGTGLTARAYVDASTA